MLQNFIVKQIGNRSLNLSAVYLKTSTYPTLNESNYLISNIHLNSQLREFNLI